MDRPGALLLLPLAVAEALPPQHPSAPEPCGTEALYSGSLSPEPGDPGMAGGLREARRGPNWL